MKRLIIIFLVLIAPLAWSQDKTEALKKMEAVRSTLSKAHQFMLTEDFASTGFRVGYIEDPADASIATGITQPQGTAADNLKATAELPATYTIWIQTADAWYVSVRKEQTAIFLKLQNDADGEMDFGHGSGWCIQPAGKAFAKYPYKNGKWGTPEGVSADALEGTIGAWQQTYILTPAGDMGSDKVKLFEKAAYFDDLDVQLPKK